MYHRVNTTFSDALVSLVITAPNSQSIQACNELQFCISAVSPDQAKLPSFTVTGGYIPGKFISFNLIIINISYLHNIRLLSKFILIFFWIMSTACTHGLNYHVYKYHCNNIWLYKSCRKHNVIFIESKHYSFSKSCRTDACCCHQYTGSYSLITPSHNNIIIENSSFPSPYKFYLI